MDTKNINKSSNTYRYFNSLFDIYPDRKRLGAVYGYCQADGTMIEFPCRLDVSNAVMDSQGRWTASSLGLKPVSVRYSDSFGGSKEIWVGEGFGQRPNARYSGSLRYVERIRFLDNVTSIGEKAFKNFIELTEIIIPPGVTEIGNHAFLGCSNLKRITLPDSITKIGEYAFSECDSLTEITIPPGVTEIGAGVFSDSRNLKNITLPDSITKIGEYAFFKCNSLTEIIIPSGVTELEYGLFSSCSRLTAVSIPCSIRSIGELAFDDCCSLADITIPEGVVSIKNRAFAYCVHLTGIRIPESVASIGRDALLGCTKLTGITYSGTMKQWNEYGCDVPPDTDIACRDGKIVLRIRRVMYQNTEYGLADGLTPYGKNNCKEIVIPEGIRFIGAQAFRDCNSITGITIPPGVTSIDEKAFCKCRGLTDIVIPEGVTEIGKSAFLNCDSLNSLTIPSTVTEIEPHAFEGCVSLTDIYINQPESNAFRRVLVPFGCVIHWKSA